MHPCRIKILMSFKIIFTDLKLLSSGVFTYILNAYEMTGIPYWT